MKKRRVLDIIFIIFAFLLVVTGSILLICGAIMKIDLLVYISIGFIGTGFLTYIILFIFALKHLLKKGDDNNASNS